MKNFSILNSNRVLYINVDFSKKFGINGIFYHVKILCDIYFIRSNIEPIMFFNYLLISIETRYWLIELKFAKLIWILRKTRYLIKISQIFNIVCTNHEIAFNIVKQIILITTSTNKLNLHFVRVSNYTHRFF